MWFINAILHAWLAGGAHVWLLPGFLISQILFVLSAIPHESKSNNLKESSGGYDKRFPLNNTKSNNIELYNIAILLEKKKLLDILQNEKVSLLTKIFLLNDNTIKPHNIFAGNLMSDFENF